MNVRHQCICIVSVITLLSVSDLASAGGHNPVAYTATSSLPVNAYQYDSVAYRNYVYVIGGWNGSVALDSVYVGTIDDSGAISSWVATTPLPEGDQGPGVSIWRNHIYVSMGNGNTYRGDINPDGTISAWQIENSPASFRGGRLSSDTYDGYIYVLGGWDGGGFFDSVYYAPINADGTLGTWNTTTVMPGIRQHTSVHIYSGRIYIAGGITSGLALVGSVHSAAVNSDGTIGPWRAEASLPTVLWLHNSVMIDGMFYIFGGRAAYGGSSGNTNIYRGVVNPSDGSITFWETVGAMPTVYIDGMGAVHVPIRGGLTYLIGGNMVGGGLTGDVQGSGSICLSDINGDGPTNVTDLLLLLGGWGVCP